MFSSTFSEDPSYIDLLGALSLIIWSLTLMVTIKYCLIVLRADDEGEGGTFALFSLLSRYANIVRRDPREEQTIQMERISTNKLGKPALKTRNFMERSKAVQWLLKITGVFGVALVMSDGVLTPAQSVLGAIQGLNVVSDDVTKSTIVGVSVAILVLLFLIQPFGVTKLASTFAPIVIIWLLFLASFGIYNLAVHDHTVLKAFSPYFAGSYLVRNGDAGWRSLGGILLSFTGCEILFADIGAFTRRAVQLSWLAFAYPCLLLAYIGQAAYMSEDPTAWSNPFYNTVPPGTLYPSLVIAILAAIVASQATITAVFQLVSQMMKLSYFPQIKLVHTSKIFYGQLYVPMANWLLMIGTVIVTAVYNNTTSLGHAYGFCVILVTFITTNMVALVALIVWQIPSYIVLFVWLVFALFDGTFISASVIKVPDGAWFTLVLAVVLSAVFVLWRFGKERQWRAEASDRFPPSQLLSLQPSTEVGSPATINFTDAFGGHAIARIPGIGIFFDKAGSPTATPAVFLHFLTKFRSTPEVMIFFHLRPLQRPSVPPEERYAVTRCYIIDKLHESKVPLPNCFRIIIRHGYNDEIITNDLGLMLYEQIRNYIIREGIEVPPEYSPEDGEQADEKDVAVKSKSISFAPFPHNRISARTEAEQAELAGRLAVLQTAYESQTVYMVGKEQMRINKASNFMKKIVLGIFLFIRENTRTKVQALNVNVEKLVEVGFVKEI